MKTALVLGAGGFIGSHMVKRLKSEGYHVTGIDLKHPEFDKTHADKFVIHDLRYSLKDYWPDSLGFDEVYQFAADMGGAGYIFTGEHDADIMSNSALINLNVCETFKKLKPKIFYSSSACMYPQNLQDGSDRVPGMEYYHGQNNAFGFNPSLKESDAYPGNPDSEYGWEKLFSERLYLAYARNYGLDVRIARFHNIYGPEGTYKGGREKAPAAMCRKAVESGQSIEVWGDGQQTRSFLYIDDCIDAIRLLMQSDFKEPINIGSEEMVSILELAQLAIEFSGKNLYIDYDTSKNLGVRGRNSDNTLIRKVLGWEPKYTLRQGLEKTYQWIHQQIC